MLIKEKEIKGYSYADGVHWYWGDKEVAVIDEATREIEWCDRKLKFPEEVIQAIRDMRPKVNGKWIIEARRIRRSATHGGVAILINGNDTGMYFEDKMELKGNGQYESTTPDDELGKFVCSCFWNPLDNLYHYSERLKNIFDPKREERTR